MLSTVIGTPTIADFRRLHEPWEALQATADHLLCMTYDYNRMAAQTALAAGARVSVITVSDTEPLAIWPFAIRREGPFRVARSLTCGNGEEYSRPLIRRGAPLLYEALAAAASRLEADIAQLSYVEDGSEMARLLASTRQGAWLPARPPGMAGYAIRFGGFPSWDRYEASLPASLRAIVRRRHRQLRALGEVRTAWCRTPGETATVLAWLFETKRRWANSRGKSAPWLADNAVRDFYAALAIRLDLAQTPLVACVRLNGAPIAAAVAPVGSNVVEWGITTYDEAFAKFSPGYVLIDFLARWAYDHHRDLDFRPLEAGYKERWATHRSDFRPLSLFLSPLSRVLEGLLLVRRQFQGRLAT